jgi:hypothetical protein
MFIEAIQQRITDYNRLRGIYTEDPAKCPSEINEAIRTAIISITILAVVYLILIILSMYYAFKCSIVNGWSMFVPILLILASLTPTWGGFITVGIIIYGMNVCGSICEMPNDMRKSMSKL